ITIEVGCDARVHTHIYRGADKDEVVVVVGRVDKCRVARHIIRATIDGARLADGVTKEQVVVLIDRATNWAINTNGMVCDDGVGNSDRTIVYQNGLLGIKRRVRDGRM